MSSNSEMQWPAQDAATDSELGQLREQLRSAQAARADAEQRALRAEREMQGELAAQAIVVARLEDHLAASRAEKDKSKQRLVDLERKLRTAHREHADTQTALHALERKLELLGPEPLAAADLAVEKAKLQERLERAQNELQKAKGRGADLRRQLEAARGDLEQLRERQGREGSAVLTQRLYETRARAARLEAEKAEAESRIAEQGQGQDRLRQELERLREQIKEQAALTSSTEARLQDELRLLAQRSDVARNLALEEEAKRLQGELEALNVDLEQQRQEARALHDLVVERSAWVAQFERRNRELGEELANAEQEREEAEKARDLAESAYSSTQQELEAFTARFAAEARQRAQRSAQARRWSVIVSLLLGALFGVSLLLLLYQYEVLGGAEETSSSAADNDLSVDRSESSVANATPGAAAKRRPAKSVAAPSTATGRSARTLRDDLRQGGWGPQMVLLPGGTYSMGSPASALAPEEQPQHTVDLKAFYLGRFEVTFEQYERFAAATGRSMPDDRGWGRGSRPVIGVSWNDAQAYADWLSSQTGEAYRLPSEAEWEYAARAGTDSPFWWGYEVERNRANCFDCESDWDFYSTAPVGRFAPNGFGLFDTAGNVMEWVADCYHASYTGAPVDGKARSHPDCAKRVVRGGAFNKPADSMRSAKRGAYPAGSRMEMLGFRVVRER